MIRLAHHQSKVESRKLKILGRYDLRLLTKVTKGSV